MPKLSAGLLLYQVNDNHVVEVLIVHPGGPFWARKDDAAWSIAKGEYAEGDDPHAAALREFEEELGSPPPSGEDVALGERRQPSGKRLTVWARQGGFAAHEFKSNEFEMEWPKGSGKMQTFPEVDRAEWFPVSKARVKLLKGHVPFLDDLMETVRESDPQAIEGEIEPEQSQLF